MWLSTSDPQVITCGSLSEPSKKKVWAHLWATSDFVPRFEASGTPRQQGVCSHWAHLWAISDFVPPFFPFALRGCNSVLQQSFVEGTEACTKRSATMSLVGTDDTIAILPMPPLSKPHRVGPWHRCMLGPIVHPAVCCAFFAMTESTSRALNVEFISVPCIPFCVHRRYVWHCTNGECTLLPHLHALYVHSRWVTGVRLTSRL